MEWANFSLFRDADPPQGQCLLCDQHATRPQLCLEEEGVPGGRGRLVEGLCLDARGEEEGHVEGSQEAPRTRSLTPTWPVVPFQLVICYPNWEYYDKKALTVTEFYSFREEERVRWQAFRVQHKHGKSIISVKIFSERGIMLSLVGEYRQHRTLLWHQWFVYLAGQPISCNSIWAKTFSDKKVKMLLLCFILLV